MVFSPRVAYRASQFWKAVFRPESHIKNEALLPHLSPAQLLLFRRMQPSEQAHAFMVFNQLKQARHTDQDLLAAALLHDVGKILSPLSIFDRVITVLARHFLPKASRRWGEALPRGWRRPFVVALQHSEWGADLAEQAGASDMTVRLIRRHQDPVEKEASGREDQLLVILHTADDGN